MTLKNRASELRKALDSVDQDIRYLTEECVVIMQDLGLTKAGTADATMSISYEAVPSVDTEHWDEVREWAVSNGYQQILPRSINAAPWRELRAAGVDVPFTEAYDKLKVSFRKAGG